MARPPSRARILGILPAPAGRVRGGRIEFAGEDLLAKPAGEMERAIRGRAITFIPQDPYGSFNPLFAAGTQIREIMKWKSPLRRESGRRFGAPLLLERYSGRRARDDRERVHELLRLVRIPRPEEALRKLPHEFSGGQRQRLMIAMALLPDPRLIIADEPTTALDVTIQAQILGLLRRLVKDRGISVLFTTHDLGTAYELCDRVTVMYAGQEMESAPARSFFGRPAHPYTARLLDSLPRPRPGARRDRGRGPRARESAGRLPLPSALRVGDGGVPDRSAGGAAGRVGAPRALPPSGLPGRGMNLGADPLWRTHVMPLADLDYNNYMIWKKII